MAKINLKPDCGNAPRKKFLSELNAAIANAEIDDVADKIDNEIIWDGLNALQAVGKDQFLERLMTLDLWNVKELYIDSIITHGAEASVSGKVIRADDKQIAFCHIYTFSRAGSSKVKKIKTFMVHLN